MLNIVLFGPPGAGKGTQSEKLIQKYHLSHISTGDLFRKHLSENTELGKLAHDYMDEGNLVPDEVVIGMVEEKISSSQDVNGFIFDGFPRTVEQARALDRLLEHHDLYIDGMVALDVPDEELKKRLLSRGRDSGRSDDQSEEKINNRIQVYKRETLPVSDYYRTQGKYHLIKGIGEIDMIFDKICEEVDSMVISSS